MHARRAFPRRCLLAVLVASALAACGPTKSTGDGGGGGGSAFPQPGLPGTPIGDPTSEPVSASGGAVGSPDGFLLVEVPPGAVPADVQFTVQEVTNLAPGATGPAWRVGPEGTTFSVPVTLTFYAGATGRALDELTVAWQDGQGYWHRAVPASVRRDPVAATLAVETNHLSTWSLTTVSTARDFQGAFSVGTSQNGPFVAQGNATFTFAGEDDSATYYLLSGTVGLPSTLGTANCVPVAPDTADFPLRTNVAELSKTVPQRFDWGASGAWHVSCDDGTTRLVTVAFDTEGVGFTGCTPFTTRPLSAGVDAASGGMTWDCSGRGLGQTSASWDYASAACGTTCVPQNPCKLGTVTCGTGTAICTETADALDGSSCGTDQVCSAGACVSCTAGLDCAPANPCVAGVTSCDTGSSTCVESSTPATPLPDGLGCGTDLVCSGGACVACAAGVACTPANPCHQGLTSCATGTSVCEDTGFPRTDGSTCGTDLVCYAGACIACTQDAACASANACTATATYECSSGTAVCTDRSSRPPGTPCGAGLVCSTQGTCDSCSQGASCSTGNPCAPVGTVDCLSGSPVCVPGAPLPAGTGCGTGLVCSAAGQCLPCSAGASCTPPNPCFTGTTTCTSGTPVCVETTTPVANGVACGTNQVCNAGICTACPAGALCDPSEPCASVANIQCGSGTPVCTPQSWLPAGATCGTGPDLYCNAAHACQTCAQGSGCTPTDPCASTGTVQCGTGDPVCAAATFKAAGTGCGTGQVCSPAGSCIACAQDAPCTSSNPCAADARLECGTGVATCTDRAFKPDGTACPVAGQTCNGGTCVASRTVNGTRTASFWADASTTTGSPANGATSVVSALAPDGKGGWASYTGSMTASGSFAIPNVPNGSYWLRFQEVSPTTGPVGAPTYLDAASSTGIDLGYDQLGRSSVVRPTNSTPVTFQLGGAGSYTSADLIQLSCSNADVYDKLLRIGTSGNNFQDNWFNGNGNGALDLVASGDTATVYHLVRATDATSGSGYYSARRKGDRNNFTISNGTGTTQTITGFTLATTGLTNRTPASGSWNVLAFEALRPAMNLPATGATPTHAITVGATIGTLTAAGPVPRNPPPTLFSMSIGASPTQNPTLGALTYARVLPARWLEWREVSFSGSLGYVTPTQTLPAPTAVTESVSVGKREAAPATTALAPSLSPVRDLRVRASSGAESQAYAPVAGVGLTPTITWLAPATGTATSYAVEVFRLGLNGTGTVSTSTKVATFVTASTQVAIPTGVLTAGTAHYVRVTARAIVSDPWTAPFRRVVVGAWAQTLSGTLTP